MKYLFIFAHPDDETVACAGTIKQLLENGEEVVVASVTDGGAGEVIESAQSRYSGMPTTAIRQQEFEHVMNHLGVHDHKIMGWADGSITNMDVWGKLKEDIIELLNRHQPDVIITFDHTGWYYHLDHVGVSIATTLAFHDARTQAKVLLYSHLRPDEEPEEWNYKYCQDIPATHVVEVSNVQDKVAACQFHYSQDLEVVLDFITKNSPHLELYEWGFGDEEAVKLSPIFKRETPST